jgi:hypothetical protein
MDMGKIGTVEGLEDISKLSLYGMLAVNCEFGVVGRAETGVK